MEGDTIRVYARDRPHRRLKTHLHPSADASPRRARWPQPQRRSGLGSDLAWGGASARRTVHGPNGARHAPLRPRPGRPAAGGRTPRPGARRAGRARRTRCPPASALRWSRGAPTPGRGADTRWPPSWPSRQQPRAARCDARARSHRPPRRPPRCAGWPPGSAGPRCHPGRPAGSGPARAAGEGSSRPEVPAPPPPPGAPLAPGHRSGRGEPPPPESGGVALPDEGRARSPVPGERAAPARLERPPAPRSGRRSGRADGHGEDRSHPQGGGATAEPGRRPGELDGRSSLHPTPAYALAGVLQKDATVAKLVADAIGAGEVTRLSGLLTLGDEGAQFVIQLDVLSAEHIEMSVHRLQQMEEGLPAGGAHYPCIKGRISLAHHLEDMA